MNTPPVLFQYLSTVVLVYCMKYAEVTSIPSEMEPKKSAPNLEGIKTKVDSHDSSIDQLTNTNREYGTIQMRHLEPQKPFSNTQANQTIPLLFKPKIYQTERRPLNWQIPKSNRVMEKPRHDVESGVSRMDKKVSHSSLSSEYLEQKNAFIVESNNRTDCKLIYFCNLCLRLYLEESLCQYLFVNRTIHSSVKSNYTLQRLLIRKLLATNTDGDPKLQAGTHMKAQSQNVTEWSTKNPYPPLNESEFRSLVEIVERKLSKDPVWALLSVLCLLIVMVMASKMCGMKGINRKHEVNLDIEEDYHNDSVYDVVRRRRRYLPHRLFRLQRKLRKVFRKKRMTRVKEKDLTDPISDNSEEEKLLYSKINDF